MCLLKAHTVYSVSFLFEVTTNDLLEFNTFQVQFQEGLDSPATGELYKVLKDHKNPFMKDLVRSSYKHCYEEEVRKVVGDDVFGTQELDDCGSENVLRVTLVNQNFTHPY